jgi:hypothetical protein
MSEEPNPYAAPSSPIKPTQSGSRQPSVIGPLVYLLGWSWPFILALFGVASDRVRIPSALKGILTIASLLLPVLVSRYGGRWRGGCALLLGGYCLYCVVLMWYWN